MRLDPARFDEWFRALTGMAAPQGPFPWQRRLFREWLCPQQPAGARWPSLVQLPTASGKTALIDLAVLALAAGSPCARWRIAFVVDRRVVVDEAHRRAEAIAQRLRDAVDSPGDPLREVAEALLVLGGEQPLVVAALRGGIPGDDAWARSPAQPAVVLSTVDQVGSRLLFRAYGGHGPRSWPIHAGLLGRDTVIIVDEAHCAAPFCQTAQTITERWQSFGEQRVGADLTLVRMSATPSEEPDFALDQADRSCELLSRRLCAAKPAVLVPVEAAARDHRRPLVRTLVERAQALLDSGPPGVVAVVVNRVADARAVFEVLHIPAKRKVLLTGRVRGWERDGLLRRWLPRLQAGCREETSEPLAVVATQCIEVGANLDFDALVTEVAPLDALRQRFGRLNRLGERPVARAVIAATSRQTAMDKDGAAAEADPVYCQALCRTWAWLCAHAHGDPPSIDLGIDALEDVLPEGDDLSVLCQDARTAYTLLPAHLDLLAQTSPSPQPDPEISAFLHGTTQSSPDVTVVWRADLAEGNPDVWADRVAVQPPAAGEGCAVPVWEFRRWLAGLAASPAEMGDVEGTPA
ncbi:MAG: type I-U CRISPR-associated helicase/endonuclease Cas3 [Candidatus Latescibacterota bacterium]